MMGLEPEGEGRTSSRGRWLVLDSLQAKYSMGNRASIRQGERQVHDSLVWHSHVSSGLSEQIQAQVLHLEYHAKRPGAKGRRRGARPG